MSTRITKRCILRFLSANKVSIAIVAAVVIVTSAVLISVWCKHPDAAQPQASSTVPSVSESESTLATESDPTDTTESDPTDTTEEAEPEEPILYPEEIVEFQLPDIETSYLQTDIFTTVDNNIFYDSLVYTGYNIEKHIADGMMWTYILSAEKRGMGYLSDISYGSGSTGYETNSDGKPDIAWFEKGNLVCASYVTYVYFNYLPNVAGIDTSALTRPSYSLDANCWYTAVKDWVAKGYSEYIPFDYEVLGPIGNGFIEFEASREIPIGSIVILCNPKTSMTTGSHVTVYAGHVNGYDWLYHVGTKNGPEFTAIQRMNFGPNARWPIAVITPPNIINFTPTLEIQLVDKAGKPIAGSEFLLKHPKTGKEISLGITDENGKLVRTDLSYGDFELVQIVPEGYSCAVTTNTIKISGVNNSHNKVLVVNTKLQQ